MWPLLRPRTRGATADDCKRTGFVYFSPARAAVNGIDELIRLPRRRVQNVLVVIGHMVRSAPGTAGLIKATPVKAFFLIKEIVNAHISKFLCCLLPVTGERRWWDEGRVQMTPDFAFTALSFN